MAEKAAKELEKAQSKEKAKEMYEEWLKKKRSEEVSKKKEEKVYFILFSNYLCIYWKHLYSSVPETWPGSKVRKVSGLTKSLIVKWILIKIETGNQITLV